MALLHDNYSEALPAQAWSNMNPHFVIEIYKFLNGNF